MQLYKQEVCDCSFFFYVLLVRMMATGEFAFYENIHDERIRINYYRMHPFKESIHSPKCAKSVSYLQCDINQFAATVLFEAGKKPVRLSGERTCANIHKS